MADEDTDPEAGRIQTLDERFSRIETAIEGLKSLLPGHARPEGQAKDEGSDAASIQDQVRAELERRDKQAADEAAARADADERAQMRDQLARLTEVRPRPQTPRRTKMLGWDER